MKISATVCRSRVLDLPLESLCRVLHVKIILCAKIRLSEYKCLPDIKMFRWMNKQPGKKSFEIDVITTEISMTEYHH